MTDILGENLALATVRKISVGTFRHCFCCKSQVFLEVLNTASPLPFEKTGSRAASYDRKERKLRDFTCMAFAATVPNMAPYNAEAGLEIKI